MLKNIINKIKTRIIVEIKSIKSYKEFIKEYKAKDKEVIIISSIPTHGNIGDHAILCAEIDFLKDNFPTKDIVLLPSLLLKLHPKLLKMFVKDDTIIAITGGGFLGSLWMYEEKAVRNTIKSFKNNKIIIMPQTIFFDNNEEGIKVKVGEK